MTSNNETVSPGSPLGEPVSAFAFGTAHETYLAEDHLGGKKITKVRLDDGTLVPVPHRPGAYLVRGDARETLRQMAEDAITFRNGHMRTCTVASLDCDLCQADLGWRVRYEELVASTSGD